MHSRHLHAPLCGIFAPNSGYIARYVPFIRDRSPTNCDVQLSESNFQTRSRVKKEKTDVIHGLMRYNKNNIVLHRIGAFS
ncbi:DUF6783 domain-containing protein [uncultured Robinsoniella sp.]|uniref:DUF6783 domain-containing protein n=1 Tax=uncultured Robinsoniella sp. TaxID=904190 RepID=UPI00374FCFDD